MSNKSKSFKIGRSSISGRYKSVEDARQHPNTSQVEHNPKPGYGTAKRDK